MKTLFVLQAGVSVVGVYTTREQAFAEYHKAKNKLSRALPWGVWDVEVDKPASHRVFDDEANATVSYREL